MAAEQLIEARSLYRYYDRHCAVAGLDLELRQGEVLGLLGPNGAGKSSTLDMLSGTLAPSAGQIQIKGIDLLDRPRAAKRHLGYLPEQPPLHPDLSVDEYLTYCARLHRLRWREIAPAIANAKHRCGLQATGERLVGNLSRGYQQRVGIAQAIIHTPAVVILDEATTGLDPIQIQEIRQLIRDLGEAHSVIVSTHILPEVQVVCDRVQIINEGRTVFNDTLEGLERRHAAPRLLVGFDHPPDPASLEALPGVTGVKALADGRLRIDHEPGQAPTEALTQRAVAEGWGLNELTPERVTLEQIFTDLVYRQEPEAHAA